MNTPTLQTGKLRLERKVASKVSWLQGGAEEPGTPRGSWLPVPDDIPPQKKQAPQHLQEPGLHGSRPGEALPVCSASPQLPRCQLTGSLLITHFCRSKALFIKKVD